jgi:hypothetical protein
MLLVKGDTWEWDGIGWLQLDDMGPVGEVSLVYRSVQQRLIAFVNKPELINETWEWDGIGWTQLSENGPTARFNSAMTYDSDRDRVVLFGGRHGSLGAKDANLSDTWEWDGIEWTQQEDQGPEGRRGHALAYDAAQKQTVLFGGAFVQPVPSSGGDTREFADTWTWNGRIWRQASSFGPPKRTLHSMAFDDTLGQIVLFGGFQLFSDSYFNDTWEWNGKRWSQFQDMGSSGRYGGRMNYDSSRKCMVLFGGGGMSLASTFADAPFLSALTIAPVLNDTWELIQREIA